MTHHNNVEVFRPGRIELAIADEVTKVHAICVRCGQLAYVSHRLVENDKRVMLGETHEYEPLCRHCYQQAVEEAAKSQPDAQQSTPQTKQ